MSRAARRAFAAAREFAAADGVGAVATSDLLLALVETDGDVAAFLRTAGASPAKLRDLVANASVPEHELRHRLRLPFTWRLTAEADDALTYAVVLAGRAGRVEHEHLLASLCRGAPSRAQEVLGRLGVRPNDVQVFFAHRAHGNSST